MFAGAAVPHGSLAKLSTAPLWGKGTAFYYCGGGGLSSLLTPGCRGIKLMIVQLPTQPSLM